ncbi:TNF receptor-associated factor 3 isoform X1 [Octopus sinensis]|uniref:TNF receptor-associated factor 3 isoform X1 n=1 Tax=Octopus sinensis TaxID=2607531 RepID=A0A6P7TC10_9MOLL|nr:TNF receptor-associated factor 3 isoform X1 [Octopus sinensis]
MALSKPDPTPEFVDIEESYLCISCKNVLKNAMMTRCGHRICMECADNLLKIVDSVPCPANEEDCVTLRKFELHEDFSARRYINHQLVYCYNKCYGCPVKMLYKDLSDHSKHLNNCEYWQKKCSNTGCTWTGCLQEKEQHIETCPFQIIKCEDCDSSIRRSDKTSHAEECLNKMVSCDYCQKECVQSQLSAHWKECAEVPKDCLFKNFGCKFTGNETEMKEHQNGSCNTHLEMMARHITEMDTTITNLSQDIKVHNSDYSRTCQRLENLDKVMARTEEDIKSVEFKFSSIETEFQKYSNTNFENKKKFVNLTEKLIVLDQDLQRLKEGTDKQVQILKSKESITDMTTIQNLSTLIDQLLTQVTSIDRQIGLHDMRIEEMNSKLTSVTHPNYDAEVLMKISNYSRWKSALKTSKTSFIYSEPFYSSKYGYKMCAKVYLNGDGIGKGTHLSFYFTIMKGEYDNILTWPFKHKVTLTVLDQFGGDKNYSDRFLPDPNSKSFHKPSSDYNIATGCPDFIPQTEVESYPFMKDDTIFLKASVDTTNLR